jgi:hypothetical protein
LNAEELRAALQKARNAAERDLWFGSILAEALHSGVVIVGGAAIEVYTSGRYVSEDLDVVGDRRRILLLLKEWGFQHEGRLWTRTDIPLWVDPVGRDYTGDTRRLRTVSTPYGKVQLASVEDLIAKRLIETKVWPRGGTELFDQAVALAKEYDESIDWDYVRTVARRDHADDLVSEVRRRISS